MLLMFKDALADAEIKDILQDMSQAKIAHAAITTGNRAVIYARTPSAKAEILARFPEQVFEPQVKFMLTSKLYQSQSLIKIQSSQFGGQQFPIIAGPCSVESPEQIMQIAELVKQGGGHGLRGGAYKPRTLPYDFQGLGRAGLDYLREAADAHDLFVVSEIMDIADLDMFLDKVDMIQVGARNMQNFALLKALGQVKKPVLLKRGLSARYDEWLASAEYLLSHGNFDVILCERGIRGFETHTRNTLDIAAAPIIKDLSHLPVIIDPSHGLGLRKYVPNMAYAAMAAGADGIMVEMHTDPEQSISDAKQTIGPTTYFNMMQTLRQMAGIFSRSLD